MKVPLTIVALLIAVFAAPAMVPGDIHFGAITFNDENCAIEVTAAQLSKTPPVTFGEDAPRLTPFQAAAAARSELDQKYPRYNDVPIVSINLLIMRDPKAGADSPPRGFYQVRFFRLDMAGTEMTRRDDFQIVVLLDGTVMFPQPTPANERSANESRRRIRVVSPAEKQENVPQH